MDLEDAIPTTKAVWTEEDFDQMGWHDDFVHAMAYQRDGAGQGELLLDLDYAVKWVPPLPGERYFSQWVCPATLVFHGVEQLDGSSEPNYHPAWGTVLLDIFRGEPDERAMRSWTMDGLCFTITFVADAFTQYLRHLPVLTQGNKLTLEERSGLSFDRRSFEV